MTVGRGEQKEGEDIWKEEKEEEEDSKYRKCGSCNKE